jgi:hypothetical protein
VGLDLDGASLEPDEGMGGGARKHTSKLRRETAHEARGMHRDRTRS